ncbi:MAG: hypothetical protein K5656_10160 [Lachnospiraceae bacterium]|nr:hypothetical protein [Lachnospiraceae bacterium]
MPKKKTREEEILSIIQEWRNMTNKASQDIGKQFNKIARLEVWKWYKSYSPKEYHRKRTLYHAFKISGGNGKISVRFSHEFMYPIHRVDKIDPTYIFENSFLGGFHGGAIDGPDHPNPGVPYWRTPAPDYPEWSCPAAWNMSPYSRIEEKFDEYIQKADKKLTNDFTRKLLPRIKLITYL